MTEKTYVPLVAAADVPPGEAHVVVHEGWRYAVCNVEGTYYVVDDTCTHDDGPLGEGQLEGYAIACPRHGAKFDVRDGQALTMPATEATTVHEVKVEGQAVLVRINDED